MSNPNRYPTPVPIPTLDSLPDTDPTVIGSGVGLRFPGNRDSGRVGSRDGPERTQPKSRFGMIQDHYRDSGRVRTIIGSRVGLGFSPLSVSGRVRMGWDSSGNNILKNKDININKQKGHIYSNQQQQLQLLHTTQIQCLLILLGFFFDHFLRRDHRGDLRVICTRFHL